MTSMRYASHVTGTRSPCIVHLCVTFVSRQQILIFTLHLLCPVYVIFEQNICTCSIKSNLSFADPLKKNCVAPRLVLCCQTIVQEQFTKQLRQLTQQKMRSARRARYKTSKIQASKIQASKTSKIR